MMFQAAQMAADRAAATTGDSTIHISLTDAGKPPLRMMQTSGIRTPSQAY